MALNTELRPVLHFSPAKGWINDPNGLIRLDGRYHLFFQHNPVDIIHGPMHWGHASSPDLIEWTEHPIALFPDQNGECFSGSAVMVTATSATPVLSDGQVLLFYTSHRPVPSGGGLQAQCMAVSDRRFSRIEPVTSNPVLPNQGLADFRDPKVIWHEESRRWVMVTTHGQSIGIYSSSDAFEWRFESEFGADEGTHGEGPWECPDLFPISGEDGQRAWILIVGIGSGHPSGGSGTQYFIGDFDGRLFRNRNTRNTTLWLDWGRDHYATQSFAGLEDEAPLVLAWMNNWDYAQVTPARTFRGVMSLPRRLSLTGQGVERRLRQSIASEVATRFPRLPMTGDAIASPKTGVYSVSEVWRPERGNFELALFSGEFRLSFVADENDSHHVRVRRSEAGVERGRAPFASDFVVPLPKGPVPINIFVDNGLVECSLADGDVWISMICFPADPADPIVAKGASVVADRDRGAAARARS
ncbi:glycoside hydrolase family 32 protein [Devosia sp. D6-9]|nr:glycoside hydrolase family 32 protein [Devosia sp. D6-9]